MNVVFSSSELYAKCTGIAMLSLLENNKKLAELNIFVLTTDMSKESQLRLTEMCKRFKRTITVIEATNTLEKAQKELGLQDFKGGLNTYARALANKFMPCNIDKALFIDSDLMILGSLKDLENLDFKDNIVAGVYEISVMIANLCYEDIELLNKCPNYINYGVAYINLENWRKNDADKMIFDCIANAKYPFKIAEQSILNLAFKDKTLIIPVKYNFSTPLHGITYNTICKWYKRKKVFAKEEFEEATNAPIIVHFIGDYFNRPWYQKNICRYKDKYMEYYYSSPWRDEKLDQIPTDFSAVFKCYYAVLIFLRKNHFDYLYFKLRYVFIQWLREHISDLDSRIKRKK